MTAKIHKPFRPMLAATLDIDDPEQVKRLRFPLIVQPKIDGIRCLVFPDGRVVSRTLKPIRNKHIFSTLYKCVVGHAFSGTFDGELVAIGADGKPLSFQETDSLVMTREKEGSFNYIVFDYVWKNTFSSCSYTVRLNWLRDFMPLSFMLVEQKFASNLDDIKYFLEGFLKRGYEGIVLRDPAAPYKSGRSTLAEQYLLKVKPFKDSEALILGFEELMHNENPQEVDNLGLAERSSCQDSLIRGNTLGALLVEDIHTRTLFKIGSGFTAEQRKDIWDHAENYRHGLVKYKYQAFGQKDKPRTPIFLAFITEED